MFTFCDVLHDAKKKTKQTIESAQYGLEISFKGRAIISTEDGRNLSKIEQRAHAVCCCVCSFNRVSFSVLDDFLVFERSSGL